MISLSLFDRRRDERVTPVRLTRSGRVVIAMWVTSLLMLLVLELAL